MKKILMALIATGLTYFSAEAQNDGRKNCEVVQSQVCRKGGDCYKTKYAENFKVCKNDYGYFICCETATYSNSTHPVYMVTTEPKTNYMENYMQNEAYAQNEAVDATNESAIPQSQSYPGYNIISDGSYQGYYLQKGKGKIKACYGGDNVAELNRAPYQGCPSPQYDGQQKNMTRNLNVVTQ